MKIISSFNSAPILKNRWGIKNKFKDTLYINALSFLSLNEFYKEVTVYVDPKLYQIYKDFPFNVVKHDFSEISTDNWVNSKFEIFKLQKEPFVHFDSDIFLKRRFDFNSISSMVVEREEHSSFEKHYKEQVEYFQYIGCKIYEKIPMGLKPLNCGTLGFKDMNFFNEYIKQYDIVFSQFLDNKKEFEYYRLKGYEPSIVMEQLLLAIMVRNTQISDRRFHVQKVLNYSTDEKNFEEGNVLGYIHYFGRKKYDDIESIKMYLHDKYNYYWRIIDDFSI